MGVHTVRRASRGISVLVPSQKCSRELSSFAPLQESSQKVCVLQFDTRGFWAEDLGFSGMFTATSFLSGFASYFYQVGWPWRPRFRRGLGYCWNHLEGIVFQSLIRAKTREKEKNLCSMSSLGRKARGTAMSAVHWARHSSQHTPG